MPQESKTLDAIDESRRGLRVTFVWHRDRFAHTIAAVNGDVITPLLASEEGLADNSWPPSPALQELSIEQRSETNRVALLVGMAGTSHWSLSVEADDSCRRLIFDVAARVKELPVQLASSYRTMARPVVDENSISTTFDGIDLLSFNVVEATSGTKIIRSPAGMRVLVNKDEAEFPATVRWQYEITWAAVAG